MNEEVWNRAGAIRRSVGLSRTWREIALAARNEVEADPGRYCPECGEDIVGNDPHAAWCRVERGENE